jgi:hypothetical protein
LTGTGNLGGAGNTTLANINITGTSTLAGNVTSTAVATITGSLSGGSSTLTLTATGTPFVKIGTFNVNTSSITYTGGSGATNIASTTYYNLTINTGGAVLTGNTTSTNNLTVNSGASLNLATYNAVVSSSFSNAGTVTQTSGTVTLTGTGNLGGAGNTTLYNLVISISETLVGSVTSTNSFINNGVFTLGDYNLVASGDYTNNGTTTLSGTGVAKKAASGGMDSTAYTSGSSNGAGNTVTVSITDPTANLIAGSVDTKTATVVASIYGDSETITLTETGTSTGIFSGSIPFNIINSKTANSKLDVSGSGTLTLAYTNGYGALSGVGIAASYTGSDYNSGGSAGGSSSSGSSGTTPPPVVVVPVQVVVSTTTVVNVTPAVILPTVSIQTEVVAPLTPQFEVANADSKVVISPVKTLIYKPNSVVKYAYAYKNETTKTVKVKVVRQVLDTNGKVISKVTGSASIAKGKTFKFNASNTLGSKLADGVYTIKVQVLDFKTGKLLDENSFDITVKKPLPPPSITTNNPESNVVITGLKVDYKPGSAVKYVYSFKNEAGKPVSIKIVRQVVDENGKVVNQVTGTRTLSKNQTFKFNATSSLGSKLPVGTYTALVKILDTKNVVLDENSFDFLVKK